MLCLMLINVISVFCFFSHLFRLTSVVARTLPNSHQWTTAAAVLGTE